MGRFSRLVCVALLMVMGSESYKANAFSIESFIDPLLSMANENDGYILSETADHAARLFLSYINSTTTISASYALIIILGISFALLAVIGFAYILASAAFTGVSVQSLGKRSLPDDDDFSMDYSWVRILLILDLMEEHFRRLEAEKKHHEDCRQRIICQLSIEKRTTDQQNENQRSIIKLSKELSNLYDENVKYAGDERPISQKSYDLTKAYYQAQQHGKNDGNCETIYPNCPNL